jgi:hypothetical protein
MGSIYYKQFFVKDDNPPFRHEVRAADEADYVVTVNWVLKGSRLFRTVASEYLKPLWNQPAGTRSQSQEELERVGAADATPGPAS